MFYYVEGYDQYDNLVVTNRKLSPNVVKTRTVVYVSNINGNNVYSPSLTSSMAVTNGVAKITTQLANTYDDGTAVPTGKKLRVNEGGHLRLALQSDRC